MMNTAVALQKESSVLVVDDDDLFRESLGRNLADAGFVVHEAADGRELLDYLSEGGEADLILLDWKMPRMNGIEALRALREAGHRAPVIFLTVLGDQIYEEAALLGGAVDFVEKSRSFSILRRRIDLSIQAAASQPRQERFKGGEVQDQDIVVGGLRLRTGSSRALWHGNEVDLTLTEFRIVRYLATRAGEDVPYRRIYDLVHGRGFIAGSDAEGYRTNVRTFIKRIRQKFRNIDDRFDQIENYPGFGYRWREERSADA